MSNYNTQLQSNRTDLQAILSSINNLPDASGEQATPVISVSSNGLITATAGAKSSTHQLAFQPAKTITPSATSQIAVSSGYYTGGNVMVAGDANLVASNIKNGVSIFGVNGTLTEGGETVVVDDVSKAIIEGTITEFNDNNNIEVIRGYAFYDCDSLTTVSFPTCTSIGERAFCYCRNLTTASFPVCTSIGDHTFYFCSSLTTASFPACTTIGGYAFGNCRSLTTASFPVCTSIGDNAFNDCDSLTTVSFLACTSIGNSAFYGCYNLTSVGFPTCTSIGNNAFGYCYTLTTASFPVCTSIGNSAFQKCYNLKSLYLTNSMVCTLSNSNAFLSTPIGGYSDRTGTYGSIYVPASLLTSYQTATNWTYFSSRFVGI